MSTSKSTTNKASISESNGNKLKTTIKRVPAKKEDTSPLISEGSLVVPETPASQDPGHPLQYGSSFMLPETQYPVDPHQVDELSEKPLSWLQSFAGQLLFVASKADFTGTLYVVNKEHAGILYEAQAKGYRFETIVSRLNRVHQKQSLSPAEQKEKSEEQLFNEALLAVEAYYAMKESEVLKDVSFSLYMMLDESRFEDALDEYPGYLVSLLQLLAVPEVSSVAKKHINPVEIKWIARMLDKLTRFFVEINNDGVNALLQLQDMDLNKVTYLKNSYSKRITEIYSKKYEALLLHKPGYKIIHEGVEKMRLSKDEE